MKRKAKHRNRILLAAVGILLVLTIYGCSGEKNKIQKPPKEETGSTLSTEIESDQAKTEETSGQEPDGEAEVFYVPEIRKEEFPVIDGSTATIPLSAGLYRLVTGCGQEEAEEMIHHSKTTNAYYSLLYDRVDLVIAYEAPESFFSDAQKQGVDLEIKPIGKDALVFLTNAGNPVGTLTSQQIVDIYAGKTTNWAQAGGQDKEIIAFQRPDGSGSQTLMKKLVMKETPLADAPVSWVVGEMGELIDAVASYKNEENALGYSVYFYARNMYEQPDLKFMQVNQVTPDNQTIQSGEYPYVNDFYAAIRKDEPEGTAARKLFDWLTQDEGQALIESLGYVGIKQPAKEFPGFQEEETKNGYLKLNDGEMLLLSGNLLNGDEGIVQIGPNGEEVWLSRDYRMRDYQVGLIKKDEPVILQDVTRQEGYQGVKRFYESGWMIPPEFYYVRELEDGGYLAQSEKMTVLYDRVGNKILERDTENYEMTVCGSNVWIIERKNGVGAVYDLSGNQIRTLDFRPYGTYLYAVSGNYMKVYFDHERGCILYFEDGTLKFDTETLPEEVRNEIGLKKGEPVYVDSELKDSSIVMLYANQKGWVYDIQAAKLLSEAEDEVYFDCYNGKNTYSIIRDGVRSVYGGNGAPIRSKSGEPFEYQAAKDLYYRRQDGVLTIGDGRGGLEYQYAENFENDSYVEAFMNGTIYYIRELRTDGYRTFLFAGEKKLMEQEMIYVYPFGDECFWAEGDGGFYKIFDKNGAVLYQSEVSEELLLGTPRAIVTVRGNYLYVLNGKGETVLKKLSGRMTND